MPVKIPFAAPIARAALATLQANLPAHIAAFNAESENTIDLVEPVAYVFGADDPLGGAGFPVVEAAAMEGRTGQWSVDRTEFDHDAVVNVVVWHEGDRGELSPTYEMSLGLARCVVECLAPTGAFGDGVEISQDGGVYWRADVLPADPTDDARSFLKWRVPVFVGFKLETVERLQS